MTGRTDILYYHSGDLTPWPAAVCTTGNFEQRELSPKIDADDWIKRRRHGHIS